MTKPDFIVLGARWADDRTVSALTVAGQQGTGYGVRYEKSRDAVIGDIEAGAVYLATRPSLDSDYVHWHGQIVRVVNTSGSKWLRTDGASVAADDLDLVERFP